MNDKTAEEIHNMYKQLNIPLQVIYNISHKIKSQLKKIKIKSWVGKNEQ